MSALAVACNNKDAQPTPAPSASVAAQVAPSAPAPSAVPPPVQRRHERGPGHGGVDSILFGAAGDLPLGDDLKAKVAALQGKLHDRETGPRDAMKAFSTDLAAQVSAGKIEVAKLRPDETAFDNAMKDMLGKQATALGGLHDALDAGQRKALADAVHARAAAREAEAAGRDAGAGEWVARKLERMTNDLGLDAGQQKQVGAILAKQPAPAVARDEMKKQVEAVLTAFQAESFDAAKVLQPTLKGPHDALDRQVALTSQLLAVLHPDQREKLARATTRPGRGGPGGWTSEDDDGHRGGGGGGNGEGSGGGGE
jgi:hypothetical protein